MIGNNISVFNDPLTKIIDESIHDLIKDPPNDTKTKIDQLRTIATIDNNQYRRLKTELPYITSGIFKPAFRKTENFAHINTFILDIDHLSDKELSVEGVKSMLAHDNRIFAMFTSPGNNGLKILFRMKERCYDHAQFSLFYKLFAKDFSLKYNLNQLIDIRTSDVTRACFLSYDPGCYFNINAELIQMEKYIDFSSVLEIKEIEQSLAVFQKENLPAVHEEEKQEICPDILQQIKQTLKPNIKTKKEKIIYVPEELERVIIMLTDKMKDLGIHVKGIENINYGKKFILEIKSFWAEVNVFYGKRGFSVVKTPKRGSNNDLAEIACKVICDELL